MLRTMLTAFALGALCVTTIAQSSPQASPTASAGASSGANKSPSGNASGGASPSAGTSTTQDTHAANDPVRERWEKLSPEEQARMKERYERYRALSEDERRELRERAQRLKETGERVEREMTPELRGQLDKLAPEKRQQILKELTETEAQKVGQRIREQLPESWVERIEKASPEDRARFFSKFMREQRGRMARYAIEQIGAHLKLAPEEIERLKNLPEAERGQAVLELRKQLSAQDAATVGLPNGLTQEQWDQWQQLPPEQFFERLQRHHREHLAPAGETEPARPDHSDADHSDAAHPETGHPENGKPPAAPRIAPERLHALKRLQDALHPGPEEHLEFSELSPVERHARLIERARDRCLAAIVEGGLATPEKIEELRALPPGRLLEATRTILAPLRALQHPPRMQRMPGSGEGGPHEHLGPRAGPPHSSPPHEGGSEGGARNDAQRPPPPPSREGTPEGSHDGEAPPHRTRP